LNGFANLAQLFNDEHSVTFYAVSENFDLQYQIEKVKKVTEKDSSGAY
jgi:hypothetical protein